MARATKLEMVRQQYGFLKRSIESVMQGNEDEALRIATTLRVLVHETASSKPLLKQVNSDYLQMTILDGPGPQSPKPGGTVWMYLGVGVQMNAQTGLRPIVDLKEGYPKLDSVLLGQWWNRVILIFTDAGKKVVFTRKQLVLTLANKEGGAHVDTDLPAAYEKFVLEAPVKFRMSGVATDSIHLARYAAVQAAAQMCECLERHFPCVAS